MSETNNTQSVESMDAEESAVVDPFEKQILETLDLIRPALHMDGGDVEYLGVEDGFVKLRFVGACGGCPSSTMTLQFGIENTLKEKVPGVKGVIPV